MAKPDLTTLLGDDETVLLADGFEAAFLGIVRRLGEEPYALYDRAACITILMDRDGMSADEAEEYFEFNVEGAYVGPATPGFLCRPPSS